MNEPVHVSPELLRQRGIDIARTANQYWIVASLPGDTDPEEVQMLLLNVGGPSPDININRIMDAAFTGLNVYLSLMAGHPDIEEHGTLPDE